jgi:hypothetical protein
LRIFSDMGADQKLSAFFFLRRFDKVERGRIIKANLPRNL